jgi:hypothetical protein
VRWQSILEIVTYSHREVGKQRSTLVAGLCCVYILSLSRLSGLREPVAYAFNSSAGFAIGV